MSDDDGRGHLVAVHVPDPTEPDVDELVADEETSAWVTPVRMEGPVTVHTLPSRGGSARSYTIAAEATKVLGADLRRRSAQIISIDQPLRFAYTMTECQASTAPQWPKLVPLPLTHCDELWIRSGEAASAATIVTVAEENWSH